MHCPNCGQTAQPGLARCGHCNFKLPETAHPTAAPDNGKINCWNCRHPNTALALRCEHCNTKLTKTLPRRNVQTELARSFTPNTSSHDE